MPLLSTDRLTKRFGPLVVLREVGMTVAAGEIAVVVGENGAGKSTLVACLARMLDADGGEILLGGEPLPRTPSQVRQAGVEVVWQDQGLCDDLDVVANLFLGHERGRWLCAESDMRREATSILRRIGMPGLPLDRPVRSLSRGQRQMVALGRALVPRPRLLLLDEPTGPLGVAATRRVQALLTELRAEGIGILLVTHDLDQVFALADRIVVLREGRVSADLSPLEVSRDDVIALMSGVETDSMARQQLKRLQSLVDQLADVEPAASLPLIVSAMAAALGQDMLCVHLLDTEGARPVLRRSAAVGLPAAMFDATAELPIGADGGPAGVAAASAQVCAVSDMLVEPGWPPGRTAASASGIRSAWAAPIVGGHGVLGTVLGFGTSAGNPAHDQLELATIYLGHAAAAIERERLLEEVSRHNRVLEALRGMLETLAGPEHMDEGLDVALLALAHGLGADAVGVVECADLALRASVDLRGDAGIAGDAGDAGDAVRQRLRHAAASIAAAPSGGARLVTPVLAAAPLRLPDGRAALVALWTSEDAVAVDALSLLDDAGRSLALALERQSLETARREAAALRRSQSIQRELLSRLSHELRTPLTAIQGYASTLRQPDLTWDPTSTRRFLHSIATESARMERLVGDLLDSTAIQSGVLRLHRDWCDLGLIVDAARGCLADAEAVRVHVDDGVEPIWADHDRLEQVLVNLLDNAASHGRSDAGVDVTVRNGPGGESVEIEVRDHGPGLPAELSERVFEPRVRGGTDLAGAGLGLSIARGIIEAHGGTLHAVPVDPGASFVLALPVDGPADAPAGPADGRWNFVTEPADA